MVAVLELGDVRLSELPGVGSRTAARLVEFFGGEREAVEAIAGCRLSLLAEAVGRAAAHRIIHGVYRLVYGRWPRSIAYSEEAWRLLAEARSVLEAEALTAPGRDVLACALPGVDPRRAFLRRFYSVGFNFTRLRALQPALARWGGKLSWPRPTPVVRVNRLLVVVGDGVAYREAKSRLGGVVRVAYAEDPGDVEAVGEGYEDVVVYDPYGLYRGPRPRVESLELEDVAPEAIVEFFKANWEVLSAVVAVASHVGFEEFSALLSAFDAKVSPGELEGLETLSRALRGGDVSGEFSSEYERLRRAVSRLEQEVDNVEAWLNDMLRAELEKLEVKLPASKLLELLSTLRRGGPPPEIELPEELVDSYLSLARKAVVVLAERLGLTADEAGLLEGIVPPQPSYPVELNRERLDELRSLLSLRLAAVRLEAYRRLARMARGLKRALVEAVEGLAVADAVLAALRLADRMGVGVLAEVESGGLGVGFRDAVEAQLLREMQRGRRVQPVTYVVGRVDGWSEVTRGERVVLLTGANSGGKTTLLKTIAETVLLAHAGLPVYARAAWVSPFDTVVFISKPPGEVGAGALEQVLRSLAEVAAAPGRKLVLIDELEAATEAGAGARIIAGFIEQLLEQPGSVAVVVTHLADAVLEALNPEVRRMVRVDGIEAVGLDENYNLIVDRNPKYYHHARSTPELVVRKLAHTARGEEERRFYTRLLAKLGGGLRPG